MTHRSSPVRCLTWTRQLLLITTMKCLERHVIVGRNFGSYVTHETKHFIYFYLGQVAVLLFKSGWCRLSEVTSDELVNEKVWRKGGIIHADHFPVHVNRIHARKDISIKHCTRWKLLEICLEQWGTLYGSLKWTCIACIPFRFVYVMEINRMIWNLVRTGFQCFVQSMF